ncbi:MAG: hypothetical protein R3F03_13445 [Opitutaceae bacterium]
MLIAIVLCGCSPRPPTPPTDEEVISYFWRHERELTQLVSLGEKHPALTRAEPKLAKYPDFNGQPSNEDLRAQETAYKILEDIDADFIEWSRKPDGKIFQAKVPFYRWGLSLGGFSKGLAYLPNFREKPPRSEQGRNYRQIGDTAWFIEESDTR